MTEQSPNYLPEDDKLEALDLAECLCGLQRYLIGTWGYKLAPKYLEASANELRRLHAENATIQADYDAAQLEITSLQARLIKVNEQHRKWFSHSQCLGMKLESALDIAEASAKTGAIWEARAKELERQLDAVGAGGVEPLRRGKCLHQIAEPKQKPVAFGSAEEFSSSDDPHCKDGGEACINCLMLGECLLKSAHGITNHQTGCGACGDGCKSRGSCRLADESPEQQAKATEGGVA